MAFGAVGAEWNRLTFGAGSKLCVKPREYSYRYYLSFLDEAEIVQTAMLEFKFGHDFVKHKPAPSLWVW